MEGKETTRPVHTSFAAFYNQPWKGIKICPTLLMAGFAFHSDYVYIHRDSPYHGIIDKRIE